MDFNLENLTSEEKETLQSLLTKLQEPSIINNTSHINKEGLRIFLESLRYEDLFVSFDKMLQQYDDYFLVPVSFINFATFPCIDGDLCVLQVDFHGEKKYTDSLALKKEANGLVYEIDFLDNIFKLLGGI